MARHTVREELVGVLAFVGAVWCVFLVGLVPLLDLTSFGIVPRTLGGLIGIPAAPFLHANLAHLVSNTLPLTVLLLLLAGSRAESWRVVVAIVLVGGGLLWLLGRPVNHIGASALIYGLVTYLIASGVLERRLVPLTIALIVGVLYGGSLALAILPSWGSKVSWEGHLFGAIAGVVVAWWLSRVRAESKPVMLE
jgi:membrane associated rhomboid family serine protease